MKLLFDHNLSFRLVAPLTNLFPGSAHVRDLGLATANDSAVWDHALKNGFTIVSKDSDFYHRSILLGHPPKVVWLRLGNCTTAQVLDLIQRRHSELLAFDGDPYTSFLSLS